VSAVTDWVSVAAAARETGHCRKTLMRWIERRRIDFEVTEGPEQARYRVRIEQVKRMRRRVISGEPGEEAPG
jgi:hypothetical protein